MPLLYSVQSLYLFCFLLPVYASCTNPSPVVGPYCSSCGPEAACARSGMVINFRAFETSKDDRLRSSSAQTSLASQKRPTLTGLRRVPFLREQGLKALPRGPAAYCLPTSGSCADTLYPTIGAESKLGRCAKSNHLIGLLSIALFCI